MLACVGGVRDKPSDNRNTTVQVVEAANEGADKETDCSARFICAEQSV